MKENKIDNKIRKNEQRKSAQSDIFKACSDIVYCFLKSPDSELSAKDIQNSVLQDKNTDKDSTDTEISSNVYRKALLYLCDDVYFLEKASYGKYELSDYITPFSSKDILSKLKLDKNKLNEIIKEISSDEDTLKLIIPKNDEELSLKAQKLCSLFRGNDTSIVSDIFQSAFRDFTIFNFGGGLIQDVFLGEKLHRCFNSKDHQLMPVLLQIIKYGAKIDIDIEINSSSLTFKNITIKKVEITDEHLYLLSDLMQIKLNSIDDIQKIKIVSQNMNIQQRTGIIKILPLNMNDSLKSHENYPVIEHEFNKFKEEYGLDYSLSFEKEFRELIRPTKKWNNDVENSQKSELSFLDKAARHIRVSKA